MNSPKRRPEKKMQTDPEYEKKIEIQSELSIIVCIESIERIIKIYWEEGTKNGSIKL